MHRTVRVHKDWDGQWWLDHRSGEPAGLLGVDRHYVDQWLADHSLTRGDLTFNSRELKAEFEANYGSC